MSDVKVNFDSKTIDVLKNFSTINKSILFKEGKKLTTISPSKNILATVDLSDTVPKEFAIFDLPKLIATISLFQTPEFGFTDTHIDIKEKGNSTKVEYVYTEKTLISTPANDRITMPSEDVTFTLKRDVLEKAKKAAAVLDLKNLFVTGDREKIRIVLGEDKNITSNKFSMDVGETTSKFSMIFSVDNLKMIPEDYKVTISSKGLGYFSGKGIEYWIATEKNSFFEK